MTTKETNLLQSVEYGYLEELIRGYKSRYKSRLPRIYLVCQAWSYSKHHPPSWSYSGFQSGFYLEKQPDGELHLKSNKGKAGVFARWLPNNEVVITVPKATLYTLSYFFHRRDGFEVEPGDRYVEGIPVDLVPSEQLEALDQKATQLANYLLPSGVEFAYMCRVDGAGNPHFRLKLFRRYSHARGSWEIPKGEPGYRKTFQAELLKVCQERQIVLPHGHSFESYRARGRTEACEILCLLAS